MQIHTPLAVFALVALSAGCTAIEATPVPASSNMRHVCIRDNPKVSVDGFVGAVRSGFQRHGISSEMIAPYDKADGQFIVSYTALRSWDLAPYLSVAEVHVEKDGKEIGVVYYHLRGKGGLSMLKWQSPETKMPPVMDALLTEFPEVPVPKSRPAND